MLFRSVLKTIAHGRLKKIPYTLKPGDLVRISHLRTPFTKEHNIKWTYEIFKVASRARRQNFPIYTLKDFDNEVLKGTFYEQELQKIDKDLNLKWDIENVLRKKSVRGKVYYLVRWLHWPPKFDSWVAASDIENKAKRK